MKFVPKRLEKTADVSRGHSSWQSFLKNSVSVVIVFVLGYLLLGGLADLLAWSIPNRWEARMFSSVPVETIEQAELGRADEIFRRLTEREGLRPLPYRLFVLPIDEPNAFAFPGGGVGVTRGLLDTVETEAGLAMVLGHELGHHHERHTLKRIGRSLVFSVAGGLLFGRNSSSVVDLSLKLAESGYSRRQEREADAFGLRLVHEVYGHTRESLEFFERIRSEHDRDELQWAAFVRSHPLPSDRIEELKQLQLTLGR